jgi:hypothetical protein
MSEGIGRGKDDQEFILSRFPNAVKAEKANSSDDRNGTDWWITMQSGEVESLDMKVRRKDYSVYGPSKDDVALELWSKLNEKVGWTRDTSKRTNWIMWKWRDTKRYLLLPFPWLCSVFSDRWEEWYAKYDHPIQNSTDKHTDEILWQSQCILVPRKVLWVAMYDTFGGNPIHSQRQVNIQTPHSEGLKRADQGYNHRGEPRQ